MSDNAAVYEPYRFENPLPGRTLFVLAEINLPRVLPALTADGWTVQVFAREGVAFVSAQKQGKDT